MLTLQQPQPLQAGQVHGVRPPEGGDIPRKGMRGQTRHTQNRLVLPETTQGGQQVEEPGQ